MLSTCANLMCSNNISNKRNFRKWAAKGGHPDKGGSTERFQDVINCIHKDQYCDYFMRVLYERQKRQSIAKETC